MMKKIKEYFHRNKYWILVSITYLTLIYSTGLHYAFGKERTIDLAYFVWEEEELAKHYPDLGSLIGEPLDYNWRNIWKLSSFCWDCGYYLLQSEEIGTAIPPYKYRVLPPIIVKMISTILQISKEMSFVIMNIAAVFLTALLFNLFLIKDLKFSKIIAFIGGILFVTMVSVTRTVPFPMLDPISYLVTILIFIAVIRKNPYLFLFTAITGVMTKEILAISALMWFVETFQLKNKITLLKNTAIAAVPIIIFVIVRISLGGSAFEVEYGHNILRGEFPELWNRFFNIKGLIYIISMVFLSFSFLWSGLINITKDQFFKKHAIIIPLVIIATVLFSWRITRPLGILFPLVIPMFLTFFRDDKKIDSKPEYLS